MAGYVRLQPLTKVTKAEAQRVEGAVDLGDFGQVTVQMRTAVAGGAGSVMYLQHAAELEEHSFTDCAAVALDAIGSQVVLLPAPLRFLRWRAALIGAAATFQIDVIGREGTPAARWRPLQVIKDQQNLTTSGVATTLTWDETASVSVAGEGLTWDDAEQAIAVTRTGLVTLHYNVSAWNSATWPALVNGNTWLEEYDGSTWNEVSGSRSYVWAVGGTHSATLQRVVYSSNRKYRVRGVNLTAGGPSWRFDSGCFWARWVQ